jgi:hypothetical protein
VRAARAIATKRARSNSPKMYQYIFIYGKKKYLYSFICSCWAFQLTKDNGTCPFSAISTYKGYRHMHYFNKMVHVHFLTPIHPSLVPPFTNHNNNNEKCDDGYCKRQYQCSLGGV